MSQNWPSFSGPDDVSLSKLLDRFNSLRSLFSGTARPSSPDTGQLFFDTDSGPIVEICTNSTGPVWAGLATVLAASELLDKIKTVDGSGSGLDADLLDGQSGAYYLAASSYTAADVLAKLLTVDGAGSGIDADLLDGQSSAYYLAATSYTAADVLAKLLTVDGAGSGIDADLLDGQSSAYYTNITARLGYTPVQQGTGTGQGSNAIKIGWLGSALGLGVDGTDFGATWPISISGVAATATLASTVSANAVTSLTADAAPDMSADYALTYDNSATALKKVLLQYIGAGKQAIWISAGGMKPRDSNGCAALASFEASSNKQNYDHLAFDGTTQEFSTFDWRAPKAIGTGTFTAIFVWSHPSTATNFGVVWGISAVGRGDGDAMDVAWGTEVFSVDTGGTTDTIYHSPVTSALTVGGSFAAEDLLKFQISRTPTNGSDTLAVDARLHGVWLIFTTTQNTEQ